MERHEIGSGGFLGDGVLDLQTRVHLQEHHAVAGNEKLDGPCAAVVHGGTETDSCLVHRRAHRIIQQRGGGDLKEFLVATLHRTVPVPERADDRGAGPVGATDDLDLDVTGIEQGSSAKTDPSPKPASASAAQAENAAATASGSMAPP